MTIYDNPDQYISTYIPKFVSFLTANMFLRINISSKSSQARHLMDTFLDDDIPMSTVGF